jgi:hypothetical protein
MAHFAQIDDNNIVVNVIVAEQDFIDSGAVGNPTKWIQTSYNTQGGVHKLGGIPLRKNYAGIGYYYHAQLDAFIPPKPFPSFILDEITCLWKPPTPYPNDGKFYIWNEDTVSWIEQPDPSQLQQT